MSNERSKVFAAVHLFLVRRNEILLLRRFNTGWQDGNYSVPAGHVDGGEKATKAMIREAMGEIGITISEDQLRTVHVMHRKSDEERVDFFFEAIGWSGEPKNLEPNKCDDLSWHPIDALPSNTIPYIRAAVEHYRDKILFSEFGWK